jgi:mycofactocin glycosyltransferase
VDVVVPFRGRPAELEELLTRLARIRLRTGDSVVVVDNTPRREPVNAAGDRSIAVLRAAELSTPGFARNRGAARGSADWLVFLDADVVPPRDLLDRYFVSAPAKRTGLLAGGVRDEPVPSGGSAIARYAYLRGAMSQEDSFRLGKWGYPKTANAACRRAAFADVGGFREDIRAAEDADLAYRLRAEGWDVERREDAVVVHRNRQTVRGYVAQKALHGSGGAWLDREYPGSFPARGGLPGLTWWGVRTAVKGLLSAVWSRDRDAAAWALFEPLEVVVWEIGRSLPNERPLVGSR